MFSYLQLLPFLIARYIPRLSHFPYICWVYIPYLPIKQPSCSQNLQICLCRKAGTIVKLQYLGMRTRRGGEKKGEDEKKPEKERQPEKSHPIAKPKKFKTSIEAKERIERSKQQKMYLLSAGRDEGTGWRFNMEGASGSNYIVHVHHHMSCSCRDFHFKQKPCKHIFFIVTQVAQNEEILTKYQTSKTKMPVAVYNELDQQLQERLKARMQTPKADSKEIDLKDDTDCVICYCEMEKETEDLTNCDTCKKYFHQACLSAWKRHNPTCPLCRGDLYVGKTDDTALGRIQKISI